MWGGLVLFERQVGLAVGCPPNVSASKFPCLGPGLWAHEFSIWDQRARIGYDLFGIISPVRLAIPEIWLETLTLL